MKRREILKYTTLATGTVISTPLLNVVLSGCSSNERNQNEFSPEFFNPEEFELLVNLVDIILPPSDTPGAKELKVDTTIDEIVGKVYDNTEQQSYKKNFTALSEKLNAQGFLEKSVDEKNEILKSILSSGDSNEKTGLIDLKQQTVAFYLMTEEIGENHLNYLPVPGEYEGCINLVDVGSKKWAI